MKVLVLGIGNPILTDDGVGIHAVRELRKVVKKNVSIEEASAGGLALMEMMLGYDKVIIIDAIKTGKEKVGKIYKFTADDFKDTLHSTSPHDMNLFTALEIGKRSYPEKIPKEVIVFAIEVKEVTSFGESMSEDVEKALPRIVESVLKELS